MYVEIVSDDPMDYVKVALSLETLAYHNKGFLGMPLSNDNGKFSEQIQWLLQKAVELSTD